jgi:NADH-quinone oxidoreductase subunit L
MTASTAGGLADTALWMLLALPAVLGAVLALAGPRVAGARVAGAAVALSVATAAAGVVLAGVVALTRPEVSVPFMAGSAFGMRVDPLSALVVATTSTATLLVLLFAAGDGPGPPGRFHGLMLLFAAAAILTATATTLSTLLLAWEVMGATSYALIGFWWREERRVSGGLTAFLTTRTADLGLYLAAGAALAGGAGLALTDLPDASSGWRHVVAAGVLVAAFGKAAQLPFSFWLSRAMEGPSPASALLHSAAMVAMGGYLLLRSAPLLAATGWAADTAAWVGVLTALLLGAVALVQDDLKQMLAASTAAQLGFVVLGAGLSDVPGGTAHLVGHAATKALLFLLAGAWLAAVGSQHLDDLRGIARRWPVLGLAATVGALALAGIPPLSLWATKDAVLATALVHSPALYVVGLAASVLSAAYAGRLLVVVWRPANGAQETLPEPGGHGRPARGAHSINAVQHAAVVVLAAGAAVLGLLALPPVGGVLRRAMEGRSGAGAGVAELALSGVLALATVAGMAVLTSPRTGPSSSGARWLADWLAGWLGLERATHATVVRPTRRLAHALARFDDRVLDRGVTLAATGALAAACRLAGFDDRGLDVAVGRLAGGVRRFAETARGPQTGLLHQYYLQAVVVLAAAVVLLVSVR